MHTNREVRYDSELWNEFELKLHISRVVVWDLNSDADTYLQGE